MNIQRLQKPQKQKFMDEEEIQEALRMMEQDTSLNTTASFSFRRGAPPTTHAEGFRKRHTDYLKEHPKVNPEHYLSNLRAVLRIRT